MNKPHYSKKIDEDFKEIKNYFYQVIEVIKNNKDYNDLEENEKKSIKLIHLTIKKLRESEKHFKTIAYILNKYNNIIFED